MGGHKWVPQNRGLNVCTSGYGNTTAVYYDERLDHFSYARYEANEIARAAARELELRAALRDAERAVKEDFLAELFFVDHSAVEEQRLLLPFKLRELELFPSVSSSFSSDGEAQRPSPVILLSWLPAFFAAFLALARCTIFVLLVLLALLPSVKAMEMPPFGVPPSPSGGSVNTAFAAGAVAVSALAIARLHGGKVEVGVKGFQRKKPPAVPAPLAPASPAAPPPPIKKGRLTSPAPAAAAPLAQNSLLGALFPRAPQPSPASRFSSSGSPTSAPPTKRATIVRDAPQPLTLKSFFGGARAPQPSPASRFALPAAAVFVPRAPLLDYKRHRCSVCSPPSHPG